MKPNFVDDRNGRLIVFKDKISIVKEDDKLITLRYGRVSKHWKEL